jgi:hypothetical protein
MIKGRQQQLTDNKGDKIKQARVADNPQSCTAKHTANGQTNTAWYYRSRYAPRVNAMLCLCQTASQSRISAAATVHQQGQPDHRTTRHVQAVKGPYGAKTKAARPKQMRKAHE